MVKRLVQHDGHPIFGFLAVAHLDDGMVLQHLGVGVRILGSRLINEVKDQPMLGG